jgi:hypothetical protein
MDNQVSTKPVRISTPNLSEEQFALLERFMPRFFQRKPGPAILLAAEIGMRIMLGEPLPEEVTTVIASNGGMAA